MPARRKWCQTEEQRLAAERNEEITRRLEEDSKPPPWTFRIPLFGPPGCGKSTFLKMARLTRSKEAFSEEYRKSLRGEIFTSIIELMQKIIAKLDACDAFDNDMLLKPHILVVLEAAIPYEHHSLGPDLVTALKWLWGENLINERGYGMVEDEGSVVEYAARHYLDDLDRICSDDYIPSPEDIIKLHQPTQGIETTQLEIGKDGNKLIFYEIGHMVSERRKWLPYIDDVDAIAFMVPISMYSHGTGDGEDAGLSSLQLALDEFDALVNSPHEGLKSKNIMIFLNGIDQFKRKLPSKPIKAAFPEFEGADSLGEAGEFIIELFTQKVNEQTRDVYLHFTASLDFTFMRFLIKNIYEYICPIPRSYDVLLSVTSRGRSSELPMKFVAR